MALFGKSKEEKQEKEQQELREAIYPKAEPADIEKAGSILITTAPTLEGKPITGHLGIVSSRVIFRTTYLSFPAFQAGRLEEYEGVLQEMTDAAMLEMQLHALALGADAVVAISIDYDIMTSPNHDPTPDMLLLKASGTAVTCS